MNRFLAVSFGILSFILLGVLFTGSSASAASTYDNTIRTVDKLQLRYPTETKDVSNNYMQLFNEACEEQNTNICNQFLDSQNNPNAAWAVIQTTVYASWSPGIRNEPFVILFWTADHTTAAPLTFTQDRNYKLYRIPNTHTNWNVMTLTIRQDGTFGTVNNWVTDTISTETIYNSYEAKIFLLNYPFAPPPDYDGVVPPENFAQRVTIPIFAAASPSWSQKPNHARLISQIDQTRWNIETNNLKQPVIDFKLWKKADVPDNMYLGNEVKGTDALTGTGWNVWDDLPFGEYRIVAAGIGWPYDPEIQDSYNLVSTVLDIEVDEDGFYYSWVEAENKYCFYSQNNHDGSLWGLDTDPNTGEWISPGTNPIRCQDVQQPGDDSPDSTFNKSYNFDELEQCNTTDIACHISRFFNAITSWIMQTIYNLLIPKPAFWGEFLGAFDRLILDKLGFIGYPLSWILNTFGGMIDSAVNTKCELNFGQFGGGWLGTKTVSANFCVIQQNHANMWQTIVIPIRFVLGALFMFASYRAWRSFMEGR